MKNYLLTIANGITFVRVLLTPIVGYCIIQHDWNVAFVLFCLAAVSDFLDGFVARKLNQQSMIGAVFDHAADKFLMISVFGILLFMQIPELPMWFCAIILGKEVSFLVVSCFLLSGRFIPTIVPLFVGKITMASQMVLVLWWLAVQIVALPFPVYILWLVTCLVVVTVLCYAVWMFFLVRLVKFFGLR